MERHKHSWLLYLNLVIVMRCVRALAYLEVYLTDKLRPKVREDVLVEHTSIPSRDAGRNIPVHIYKPKEPAPGLPPVNINAHGSGFCLDAYFGNSRWPCYLIASQLKCVVIDVKYRKAPEYPFPNGFEDIIDVIEWVHSQPKCFDTKRVSVTGFSAGGNIIFSAASELGPERICAATIFYAPVDASTREAREGILNRPNTKMRSGIALNPWVFRYLFHSYLPPSQPYDDPRVSVLFKPVETFPNHMLFVSGDSDTMCYEMIKIYDLVKTHGNPVQKANVGLFIAKDEGHAFDEQANAPESVKLRDEAYQAMIDNIRRSWN